jgi:hypothetical protein
LEFLTQRSEISEEEINPEWKEGCKGARGGMDIKGIAVT